MNTNTTKASTSRKRGPYVRRIKSSCEQAHLKRCIAYEYVRYHEEEGRAPAVVNGLMNGRIDAPLDSIKRHAKMIMAEAASRGLVTHGKL